MLRRASSPPVRMLRWKTCRAAFGSLRGKNCISPLQWRLEGICGFTVAVHDHAAFFARRLLWRSNKQWLAPKDAMMRIEICWAQLQLPSWHTQYFSVTNCNVLLPNLSCKCKVMIFSGRHQLFVLDAIRPAVKTKLFQTFALKPSF